MIPSTCTIIIPCTNDAEHLRGLLPRLQEVLHELKNSSEILVATNTDTKDNTISVAQQYGVRTVAASEPGYGSGLRAAFSACDTDYIITMDPDYSHHPAFLKYLFQMRHEADIIIASRHTPGGHSETPRYRRWTSCLLNIFLGKALALPIHDLTSGYRLYRRSAIAQLNLRHSTYAILPEILVKAWSEGFKAYEIPFHYLPHPEHKRKAHVRSIQVALDYLGVLKEMWKVRNSIESADYDWRGFDSRIPLQKWWQRKRYRIILEFIGNRLRVLDAGCGSTQILDAAPQAIGMDIKLRKLRFVRRPGRMLSNASVFALPFRDAAFEVVVCSEVIEHIPEDPVILDELLRVLEPGGSLILGTPDYGSWQWPFIEKLYGFFQRGGYADEHITHYTRASLLDSLQKRGLEILETQWICSAEMIVHARKPSK